MTSEQTTPLRLDLKRDEKLTIAWQDGAVCVYPLVTLRKMCPCAMCKEERESAATRPKTSLTVLPDAFAGGDTDGGRCAARGELRAEDHVVGPARHRHLLVQVPAGDLS